MGIDFGCLVVSLDFELLWGVLDHKELSGYMDHIRGVRRVVPELLRIFDENNIHATWGIVGMMANRDLEEWERNIPTVLPEYVETNRSPYTHKKRLNEVDPTCLFASDLIEKISAIRNQEIGMHTYCHYYCCDEGQTKEAFDCDLKKEIEILSPYSSDLRSLIFPRNQFNGDYADVLMANGVSNYRGNEKSWFYKPCTSAGNRQWFRRGMRLLDMYLNISGHNCCEYSEIPDSFGLNNIRSSRLLRPYSKKLSLFEPLRMRRIKGQMKYAAKHHCVFHLWWHPHNFGADVERNIKNLTALLTYFSKLQEQYGMKSLNMREVGELLK